MQRHESLHDSQQQHPWNWVADFKSLVSDTKGSLYHASPLLFSTRNGKAKMNKQAQNLLFDSSNWKLSTFYLHRAIYCIYSSMGLEQRSRVDTDTTCIIYKWFLKLQGSQHPSFTVASSSKRYHVLSSWTTELLWDFAKVTWDILQSKIAVPERTRKQRPLGTSCTTCQFTDAPSGTTAHRFAIYTLYMLQYNLHVFQGKHCKHGFRYTVVTCHVTI